MHVGSEAFELPNDALHQFLRCESLAVLLDPELNPDGASDWAMRRAEALEAAGIVAQASGHRFRTKQQADQALFDYARGGAFGIRTWIRDAVLELLTPVRVPTAAIPTAIPVEAQSKLGL